VKAELTTPNLRRTLASTTLGIRHGWHVAMQKFRPKTQMLVLGWTMIFVALLLAGFAVLLLPFYFKLRNGEGNIPKEHVVGLLFNVMLISATIAVFLAVCARSVFRNRKHVKDEPSDTA
jgi:RsiW-degrading membrane proteinase PrsW (M82 family)